MKRAWWILVVSVWAGCGDRGRRAATTSPPPASPTGDQVTKEGEVERLPPPPAPPPPPEPAVVSAYGRGLVTALPTRGRVVVSTRAVLYPTAVAAVADAVVSTEIMHELRSARFVEVRDGAAVIETVAERADCVEDHALGYRLRAFVPLSALVPRVATPLVQAYPDGSGWARPVGAPVLAYDDGLLRPRDWPQLGALPASALALAVVPSRDAALAPLDVTVPQCPDPVIEAREAERRQADVARRQLEVAERRAAAEEERARCEEERARRAAQRKAKGQRAPIDSLFDECVSTAVFDDLAHADQDSMARMDAERRPCALDDSRDPVVTVGGQSIASPSQLSMGYDRLRYRVVQRRDTSAYLVEITGRCAALRAVVPAQHVGPPISGGAVGSGGGGGDYVVAKQGAKVTWPDGTPAGTSDGTDVVPASAVVRDGDRACLPVRFVAERVCVRSRDLVPAARW